MSSFAVSARSKAAGRERDDLYQRILSDLRKIKNWKILLSQQLDLVTLKRLFDNFNNSINLRDTKNRDLLKPFKVPISLRNTA
jgi:hypothetical protein